MASRRVRWRARRLAAGPLPRLLELGVGPRLGGVEEAPLDRGRLVRRARRPVQCGAEAGPAVQLFLRLAPALPLQRGGREMPTHRPPDGVVLQPAGQPRPCGQQRLVRDVEAVAVHDEQPPVDEGIHHRTACVAVLPVERQLGQRDRTPDECAALVDVRQPHQQTPGQLLARRRPARRRPPLPIGRGRPATPPASR